VIELRLTFHAPDGKKDHYILLPEVRPVTMRSILDRAGWSYDESTDEYHAVLGRTKLTARILWVEEGETDFPVVVLGRDAWRFVEDVLEALGGVKGD